MSSISSMKEYFSSFTTKQKFAVFGAVAATVSGYYIHKNAKLKEDMYFLIFKFFSRDKNPEKYEKLKIEKEKKQKFWKQLKMILTVLFPSIYCKETVLLAGHTLALVGKTFLSIYIANLDGSIVKALVDRKGKTFVKRRKNF
jgi:arginine exporter protein ArgO